MAERYDYRIEKDNSFFVGYLLCTLNSKYHEPSLFQNLRIIRVLEGQSDIRIGKIVYSISKDDIMVLNNLTPRQFTNESGEKFVFEVFAFSPIILKNESTHLSLFYSKPNSFNPIYNPSNYGYEDISAILDILKKRIEQSQNSECSHKVISSLINSAASLIIESNHKRTDNFSVKDEEHTGSIFDIISGSINYIFENINEPISVSLLSSKFNVSREYYSRIFKKHVGITPSEFITKCKIDNVIHIVRYQKLNILDAAMEGGFNSSSGFYKAFHSVYKTSPKQYLKRTDL